MMKIHQEMSQTGVRVDALAAAVSATAAATASATSTGAVFDPWFGQKLGGAAQPPEHHHMGARPQSAAGEGSEEAPLSGTGSKWRLYEEKWVLSAEGKYNASKPLKWLKGLGQLHGRQVRSDMDPWLGSNARRTRSTTRGSAT